MKVTERQGKILNSIIEDYINLAEPISSEFLEKKHNFGICPASIRIEMQRLADDGFIFQPYTSAGRVPTDKGYRFFVDNLFEKEIFEFEDIFKIEETLREEDKDILKFANHLTKFLAEESSGFAILNLLERNFLLKEGWEGILKEPEFEAKNILFDFVKLLDNFEENIQNLKINSKIKIYIGKENPLPKGKNFSIISSKCCLPDEEEVILTLLGPKRMDYDRNISLINSLIKILEKF